MVLRRVSKPVGYESVKKVVANYRVVLWLQVCCITSSIALFLIKGMLPPKCSRYKWEPTKELAKHFLDVECALLFLYVIKQASL